ncbi:PAS domain-containing protein [bacterium]|nr:PAS domain-containing protein [bacterium]
MAESSRQGILPEHLEIALQKQLFNLVPFGVAVIDDHYRIVTANSHFEEYFGDWRGKLCHEVYKGSKKPCPTCQAKLTFQDGQARVIDETGLDRHGRTRHYVTHVMPLAGINGSAKYVIEMSTDVTETRLRQREYNLLFERVPCFVTIIDRDFRIVRANEKFRKTFGEVRSSYCYKAYKGRDSLCTDCPAKQTFEDGQERITTHTGIAQDGSETHYVVTTAPLSRGGGEVAHVVEIAADITQVKLLEKEKLDAERLGAVGQTVAGLAHTIKNLLMGLEGGMYMVDTGLRTADSGRIMEGWDVLQRNFDKTVAMVKGFLSFSKGRLPVLQDTDPHALARDVVELYRDAAQKQGVELVYKKTRKVHHAPLDPDGMEACLTNLVSNAIDAAMMRENGGGRVEVLTREAKGTLLFEVTDNGCGMDSEVKQKVFTSFFTTKASKGTGLGLLTTRKIVQEHGGCIEMESEPGKGSVFRIKLPLDRLELLAAEIEKEEDSV